MSTPSTLHTATTDTYLADALTAVTTEIGRTDGKASLLLAFNGAVLAGLSSLTGRHLPTATTILGALAAVALGIATVLLLLVVRPRLGGGDQASFSHWTRLTEAEIRACMAGDTRAARVRVLSRIALGKFGRLRHAVDCTLAALALLALAALTAPPA